MNFRKGTEILPKIPAFLKSGAQSNDNSSNDIISESYKKSERSLQD